MLIIFGISYFQLILSNSPDSTQVSGFIENKELELTRANQQLKKLLTYLIPSGTYVLYEQVGPTPNFQIKPLPQVLNKGKELNFKILYNEPKYSRPIYDPSWASSYFRGWVSLINKVTEARHKLFIYPIGGSSTYDFLGSLGFHEKVLTHAHLNLNLLIYNFSVTEVKKLGRQIALVGEPHRTGAQVVTIKVNDILPQEIDTEWFLFQLSTPGGYEVDQLYEPHFRSDYFKQLDKKDAIPSTIADNEQTNLKQLIQEHLQLKEEMYYFLTLENQVITEQECRRSTFAELLNRAAKLKDQFNKGIETPFKTAYQEKNYKRPVYDPAWKKNYQKGWCYIPAKIGDNLHSVFVIPQEPVEQADFFGNLAFRASYQPLKENETGILIYNFAPQKVVTLDNQILIMGVKTQAGAQIIAVNESYLKPNNDYVIQLITPDYYELDYAVFKR